MAGGAHPAGTIKAARLKYRVAIFVSTACALPAFRRATSRLVSALAVSARAPSLSRDACLMLCVVDCVYDAERGPPQSLSTRSSALPLFRALFLPQLQHAACHTKLHGRRPSRYGLHDGISDLRCFMGAPVQNDDGGFADADGDDHSGLDFAQLGQLPPGVYQNLDLAHEGPACSAPFLAGGLFPEHLQADGVSFMYEPFAFGGSGGWATVDTQSIDTAVCAVCLTRVSV